MFLLLSLFACSDTPEFSTDDLVAPESPDVGDEPDIDDLEPNCYYPHENVDGELVDLGNTFRLDLADDSPKQSTRRSEKSHILLFTIGVLDSWCYDVPVNDIGIDIDATDNDGTDWYTSAEVVVMNLDSGNVIMGPLRIERDETMIFPDHFGIYAGETLLVLVAADTTHAGWDDMIQATVVQDGFTVEDVNGDQHQLATDPIIGNPLLIE